MKSYKVVLNRHDVTHIQYGIPFFDNPRPVRTDGLSYTKRNNSVSYLALGSKFNIFDPDGNQVDLDETLIKLGADDLIYHREDGPAYEYHYNTLGTIFSTKEYYLNGVWHCYDGPCYENIKINSDGTETIEQIWSIHNADLDEEDYKKWLTEQGMDINNLTPEDKLLIDVRWI